MRWTLSIVKALLSLLYWLGCSYVAIGMFTGDRLTSNGVVAPVMPISPAVFLAIAIGAYAAALALWDRFARSR